MMGAGEAHRQIVVSLLEGAEYPRPERPMKNYWAYVLAAYGLTAAILLGYWWRVERRLRSLEALGR
jgi:hypothetical protein